MRTSEDRDLLASTTSTFSTENNCNELLAAFKYFPSLIYSFALTKSKPPVISISHNQFACQEKDRLHLPVGENYFKIVIQGNGTGFGKEYAGNIFQIF